MSARIWRFRRSCSAAVFTECSRFPVNQQFSWQHCAPSARSPASIVESVSSAVNAGVALQFAPGYRLRLNAKNWLDRKSTRLNSSHSSISYAVFCLKKKNKKKIKIKYNNITEHTK